MRAVTRPLDVDVDLNDVARSDGYLFVRNAVGFAGHGCAARVSADEATGFLADIEHDDAVGDTPGPIAVGAIPFAPGGPAELVVPAVLIGKDTDGRAWVTTIGDVDATDTIRLATTGPPAARTNGYRISAGAPVEQYLDAVAAARDAVRAGRLTKAVIARPVVVDADHEIDLHAVLHRLKSSFGSSYRYSIDGLVGASPELLVEVRGDVVRSHPLAGTAPPRSPAN